MGDRAEDETDFRAIYFPLVMENDERKALLAQGPFFHIAPACTVTHSEAEALSFVMVGANYDMHAAAKRCTGFRDKVSPLVSPKTDDLQAKWLG